METILDLHFPNGSILDVNYGLGVFYRRVRRKVIGLDLRRTGDLIADNRFLPFPADSFDIGVCDPPYRRGNGDRKYLDRYGAAPCTQQKVRRSYFELLPELIRVSRLGLIIKGQDGTDGHRFYCRLQEIADFVRDLTGLDPHDIAYLVKKGVVNNLVLGQRHFMANCVSFFLVYKWASKNPFRPVRF